MSGILIALISGALMSIQGVFNTEVTKQTSLWVSNSWVQFSALIVCLGAWLFKGRESFGMLLQVDKKYLLFRRCHRCIYYADRHYEHESVRTCKGGAFNRCRPAGRGLCD